MPGKAKNVRWEEAKAKDKTLNVDKLLKAGKVSIPNPLGSPISPHRKFYIFHRIGESVEGILGHPITNIRRNTSYPLELTEEVPGSSYYKKGDIVEIFGNKLLHSVIRDNDLINARVRIEYIGLQTIPGYGRQRKVFRVYKAVGIREEEQLPHQK